jgi:aminoglycoside phosphotransferase (APT) family kinase protein
MATKPTVYSSRLGHVEDTRLQRALDRFDLGRLVAARPVPFGLFGQNIFVTSTVGEFVLRGAAHHDGQFAQERFVAELLHERTDVPVPWPYLVDDDASVFGWSHGYAVMPRMPGLQLSDPAVLGTIPGADRVRIAGLLGATLRRIHRATWPYAGRYDHTIGTVRPFDGGFVQWIVGELRRLVAVSVAYGTGATGTDVQWTEDLIAAGTGALRVPTVPVLVLHDYREANLTVQEGPDGWRVAGVFDLMEAILGDGELDLARQFAEYLTEDPHRARAFLAGYTRDEPLRDAADLRLALFVAYDRMVIWEYFHRPENVAGWRYAERTPRGWITPYLDGLAAILR